MDRCGPTQGTEMSLPRLSTERPVAVAMLVLAVVLLGLISYARLPIDLLPDVSYPRLVVHTSYPEVAPAEVERLITERVEAEAAAVVGVERVTSISREGVSLVTLRFGWGTDMDYAMLNVRERMDNLRETLPESASRPRILRVDPESDPIMTLSVAGAGDLWTTKELAETVFRRRLEQLDGVAQAAVSGGLDREIRVEVDPERMQAYGLTIAQVSQALAQSNVSGGSGTILQGRYRYPLRTLGELQNVDEIRDVVVARQAEQGAGGSGEASSRLLRVSDIATVTDGFAERESMALYNGTESVGLLVFKESGANTVTVARSVEEVLDQLRSEFPDVRLEVAHSQAGFISAAISNVVQSLIVGGLLAFLVLFFFLRDSRYPFAIAAAIPISVVAAFALMEAFGVSLNIMSLGGLALGVGMLVDNSIVVLENIFRHRQLGADGPEAAAGGAEEVQGAITASTLTTISVFGPIIYVEGVAGELFADLSLAVTFSLLASLLAALTLLPAIAARFFAAEDRVPPPPTASRPRPSGFLGWLEWAWFAIVFAPFRLLHFVVRLLGALAVFWWRHFGAVVSRLSRPLLDRFDRGFGALIDRYDRTLRWSLDRKGPVLAGAGMALALTAIVAVALPRDLLPDVDQGAIDVHLALEGGVGIENTAAAAREIGEVLDADPDVDAVFTSVGRDGRAYADGQDDSGLNTARFQVRLREGVPTARVLARLRPLQQRFPEGALTFQVGQATALGQILGGSDADVAVRVRGQDLDLLMEQAEMVRERIAGLGMVGNVRVGAEVGAPQIDIEILQGVAAQYGVEPREVAATVDRALRGDRATEFVDFDRRIPVVVSYPRELRYARSTLEGLRVQGVPIRELVRIHDTVGPAEVRREDQGRVVPVYADVVEGGLGEAIRAIEAALADIPPSRELRFEVGGEREEMRRSFRDLAFAFGLAMILVYMILAAQFESFIHPFTILTAVPLSLVGAIAALALTGQGINSMSLIGMVILVGIVVNNAILLVDFISKRHAGGGPLREAILEAGRVRVRPILMTTVTTVLGLIPMAMGVGSGADLRAPLAIAVIGGLAVATVLTLVVIPVVYAVVEGARRRSPVDVLEPGTAALAPTGAD